MLVNESVSSQQGHGCVRSSNVHIMALEVK